MNIVQVFGNSEIRFVDHPKQKFDFGIVADDMATILEHSDTSMMCKGVDGEWKGTSSVYTPGGIQSMTVIWEPGIYQLLAKSRKPQAKQFQKWLFEQVIPTIRKTGGYGVNQPPEPQLPKRDAVEYIKAAIDLKSVNNLTLQELLRDQLIDDLSVMQKKKLPAATPTKQHTIVKVRARELGYSTTEIGNGSQLGKFVAGKVPFAFKERVGKYPVKHYLVNEDLDNAIREFFENRSQKTEN